MNKVSRILEKQVLKAARAFGAVVLTGPRRSGKTSLLRNLYPDAPYFLFEDPDVVARFRADPQGFLDSIKPPAILDEVQNVPELFNFVRARIDRAPSRKGQWFLTGSQESALMHNVSESMAGRAAVLQLLPMSWAETRKVSVFKGGYAEVLARPGNASLWFSSYVQTYLERDVRAVSVVNDLSKFRRFMSLLATRHSTTLNRAELAAPLGVSIPTISHWIDILEITGLVALVPPYFENLGKRLVKTAKLYWVDSGLVCHLLGIQTEAELERSPFLGAIYEGFVATEIIKSQINAGRRRELYFFRDHQGLEVDFVVPYLGNNQTAGITLIEVKASRTPMPEMARSMQSLAGAWKKSALPLRQSLLVHRPSKAAVQSTALSPGISAHNTEDFIRFVNNI